MLAKTIKHTSVFVQLIAQASWIPNNTYLCSTDKKGSCSKKASWIGMSNCFDKAAFPIFEMIMVRFSFCPVHVLRSNNLIPDGRVPLALCTCTPFENTRCASSLIHQTCWFLLARALTSPSDDNIIGTVYAPEISAAQLKPMSLRMTMAPTHARTDAFSVHLRTHRNPLEWFCAQTPSLWWSLRTRWTSSSWVSLRAGYPLKAPFLLGPTVSSLCLALHALHGTVNAHSTLTHAAKN